MELTSLQVQTLINWSNHIDINQPVQMEGNINPGGPTWLKIYPQSIKDIYKETDKLDISV